MRNTFDRSLEMLHEFIKEDDRLSLDKKDFKQRLQTFSDPNIYFSKPVDLSPLVCSRFGWSIHTKDLIECDDCKAKVCIKFHPDLSLDSKDKLTYEYRKMLAASHEKNCRFYFDAMRWLDTSAANSSEKTSSVNETFIVPPFFLQLGSEFQILQDQSRYRNMTRKYLLEQALKLATSMNTKQKDTDWSDILDQDLQKNVLDRIKSVLKTSESIKSILLDDSRNTNDQFELTEESVCIVIFGWRDGDSRGSFADSQRGRRVHVNCNICLAESFIMNKFCSDDNSHKRIRIEGEKQISASPFHLLHSHRAYCPYVKGFTKKETTLSGTSIPCWTVVLHSLLERRKLIAEENADGVDNNALKHRIGFIRSTLHTSIK